MNRERFADEVFRRLKNTDTVALIERSQDQNFQFNITYAGDINPSKISLENAYRAYADKGSDEERQNQLDGFVRFFSTNPAAETFDVRRLFPLVRQINYLDPHAEVVWNALTTGSPLPEDYDGPLARPFIGDLVILLGQETDTSVNFVSYSTLKESGVSDETAWDAAFGNFTDDRFSYTFEQVNDEGLCICHIENEMWLTPSLLLFTDTLNTFVDNNDVSSLLVSLPSRMGILFIDEGIAGAMDIISDVSAQMLKSDHPQSEYIFRLRRGADAYELIAANAA